MKIRQPLHRGMEVKRPVLPALYVALFDISDLRNQVSAFGSDLAADQAARFHSHLHELETEALRLIERCEPQQPPSH